jgi:hypothetical protein
MIALFIGFAAFNTFLWNYWTIAYLRLPRRGPREVAGVVAPPAFPA